MFLLNKNNIIPFLKNLIILKFYLFLSPKYISSLSYFFIIGIREKYIYVNLSNIIKIFLDFKKFLSIFLHFKSKFCFISLDPTFFNFTECLAIKLKQYFICGRWVNGFISKQMSTKIRKYSINNEFYDENLQSNIVGFSCLPFFIVISSVNSLGFFAEISHIHNPSILFTSVSNQKLDSITYPIICDLISIESVFFFCRLLYILIKEHVNEIQE